jgi:hypothetical protein
MREDQIQKGDTVCYRGGRDELAVVGKVASLDYGAGRLIRKAMVIWITGPKIGKKHIFDVRDLVKVEK